MHFDVSAPLDIAGHRAVATLAPVPIVCLSPKLQDTNIAMLAPVSIVCLESSCPRVFFSGHIRYWVENAAAWFIIYIPGP
jgi:hypothetical protein